MTLAAVSVGTGHHGAVCPASAMPPCEGGSIGVAEDGELVVEQLSQSEGTPPGPSLLECPQFPPVDEPAEAHRPHL